MNKVIFCGWSADAHKKEAGYAEGNMGFSCRQREEYSQFRKEQEVNRGHAGICCDSCEANVGGADNLPNAYSVIVDCRSDDC